MNLKKLAFFTFFFIPALLAPAAIIAQYSYSSSPANGVISDIQESTPYRFLYREAMLADLRLTFQANEENLLAELEKSLNKYELKLNIDEDRKQVILLRSTPRQASPGQTLTVSGQVVDSHTGERLPYAVVTWRNAGATKGRATGSSGQFRIQLDTADDEVEIKASYIGYKDGQISLKTGQSSEFSDVTIRLDPQSIEGNEILVTGTRRSAPQDSAMAGVVKSDRFSPMGDNNSIRSLQILPSVGLTSAVNDGMNIRGGTPDGFMVKLDDMAIFNHSHLFGLLDSFNSDAIRYSGFFYDVAPADVDIPAGGKLSLLTKTGSLNSVEGVAGISSSALRATAGGPLKNGRSSWLVSARSSYVDQVNWFDNKEVIRWGLDIDRPTSLPDNQSNFTSRLVTPGEANTWFYDLHGKLYFESETGSRTTISAYFGGDNTEQEATRTVRSLQSDSGLGSRDVSTVNDWSNGSFSVTHQRFLKKNIYSKTTIGLSSYETLFDKDDFTFIRVTQSAGNRSVSAFVSTFRNRSTMNRGELEQVFDIYNSFVPLKAGFNGSYHRNQYTEQSFDRPGFSTNTEALQGDLFLQADYDPVGWMEMRIGGRSQFYSDGNYWRFSPRLKLLFFDDGPVSFSVGYSQNHQFTHRVRFNNVVTPDVWILTNENQPPTSVDQYSAAIRLQPLNGLYLKFEGYVKEYRNLRQHEVNTQTLVNTFSEAPWFFENRGSARGMEVTGRMPFRVFTLTQSYTLSSMKLQNDLINSGESFYADWDRRHRAVSLLELPATNHVSVYGSFTIASGAANSLAVNREDQPGRLDTYHRLDLSADYTRSLRPGVLKVSVSFFNIYDRQNTWYRTVQLTVDESRTVPVLRSATADVFDLGFRPSFDISFSF